MNVAEPTIPPTVETVKKDRILYVITKANWGGAQRYVFDVAVAAQSAGYEVVVAHGTPGEMAERLHKAHVRTVHVRGLERDIRPWKDVAAFVELWRLIAEMRPEVIHINSSKAGLLAATAARILGVRRIIFTAHGWFWNSTWRALWLRVIAATLQWVTVLMAHHTICVSEAILREATWMPFVQKRFSVIHHGIVPTVLEDKDVARAKLAPASPAQSAAILSYPLWIGTLAELHPTKGLDVAIEAFALIAPQFPHAVLVLIGEGQDRNKLVALAKEKGLSDRIRFCGQVQGAARYLSAFDVFLFPSRSEALGYAALEAGNASLPVVASRVGGIPEIIEDGVTGLLVSADDVNGFAHALSSLLAAPELRTRLGNALHQKVLNNFSQHQMLEKTLATYS